MTRDPPSILLEIVLVHTSILGTNRSMLRSWVSMLRPYIEKVNALNKMGHTEITCLEKGCIIDGRGPP